MVTKRKLVRQALHRDPDNPYPVEPVDPVEREIACMICFCVYSGRCACDKRKDMPVCSSMVSAARLAIQIARRDA
jgi:hypothetical protein